jgi:hypothetical protein
MVLLHTQCCSASVAAWPQHCIASSALCLYLVSKSDSIGRRNQSTEALVAGPLPNVAHIGRAVCESSFLLETKRPFIVKEGHVIFLNLLRALLYSLVASFP